MRIDLDALISEPLLDRSEVQGLLQQLGIVRTLDLTREGKDSEQLHAAISAVQHAIADALLVRLQHITQCSACGGPLQPVIDDVDTGETVWACDACGSTQTTTQVMR
jgi:hypothetical protein